MLARKGYPPALAVRVVREALAADGADPGELAGRTTPDRTTDSARPSSRRRDGPGRSLIGSLTGW